MRRSLLLPLVSIVGVAVVGVAGNAIAGNTPSLGLDLQGGISVTKVPVGDFNRDGLELTRDRIDERVNSLGIAETEVVLQGDAIVINLPGVRDQQEALDITNVSGQVYLRPVLTCVGPTALPDGSTTTTTVPGATTTSGVPAEPTTTSVETATTSVTSTAASAPGGAGESRRIATPDDTTTVPSTVADPPTSSAPAPETPTTTGAVPPTTTVPDASTTSSVVVSDPTTEQLLPLSGGGSCYVGPAAGTGEVFDDDAEAQFDRTQGWVVVVGLTGQGEATWNALAARCNAGDSTCPSRQLAIEIDGAIQTAPVVNEPRFSGSVQISGMESEREARTIANVLRSGALPVRLENASVSAVSATLGQDSLDAAIISGIVGIALVLAFMLVYYRWLAVISALGLMVSGSLLWATICLLSEQGNLALTLSGAAGIIVSIGVTIDSYVVFFERLKDEVRSGRTVRSSVQRGFHAAWRTILAADAVSLIGAAILWYLSVGSVRGFALFLGLSTLIDIVVAWCFTRPAVLLVARSRWFEGRSVMGVPVTRRADKPERSGATL